MPAPAAVARALAEIVAETHTGKTHMTRTRLARELTARTRFPHTPADVDGVVRAASPVLRATWGVRAELTTNGSSGTRWRLAALPAERR